MVRSIAVFAAELIADLVADWREDQARLFAREQARLNARYERSRDAHRRAFAAQMAASGYAEVDGGAFGLVTPKGSLDVAESPE